MRERLVKILATGFGAGLVPTAPGTAGSVVGVVLWWGLNHLTPWAYWLVTVLVVALAVWSAGAAAELYRKQDPPCVVIDEICAMPIVLAGIGQHWWHVVIGFVWFRLFDVWKPPPVRQAQVFSGGIGIVLDDLLAAGYACATTHGVIWLIAKMTR